MKQYKKLKTTSKITYATFAAVALACLGLSPAVQAVSPPPASGYPGFNTAKGDNALFSLTTGTDNTALDSQPLASNTTSDDNTVSGGRLLGKYVSAGSDGSGNASIFTSVDGLSWWLQRQNVYSIITPVSAAIRDACVFSYAGSWWMVYTVGNFVTVTTGNTLNVVVSPAAAFRAGDVGASIAAAGIPTGTTITGFTDNSHVTISNNATASATVESWVTTAPGGFGLAASPDGVNNWAFVQNISLGVTGATATWMGRSLVDFDGTLHVFATATTAQDPVPATGMACYEVHPISQYNLAGPWSSGVNFYTNGSTKKYDIDVIRIGPLYHAFYCDGGAIRHGTSSTLTAATYNNEAVVHVGGVTFPVQSENVFSIDNDQWGMVANRIDGGHVCVVIATSTANLIASIFAAQSTQTTIPNVVTTTGSSAISSSGAFTRAMADQRWSISGSGVPINTCIVTFIDASHVTLNNQISSGGTITATVGTWADNIPSMLSPTLMASANGCLRALGRPRPTPPPRP